MYVFTEIFAKTWGNRLLLVIRFKICRHRQEQFIFNWVKLYLDLVAELRSLAVTKQLIGKEYSDCQPRFEHDFIRMVLSQVTSLRTGKIFLSKTQIEMRSWLFCWAYSCGNHTLNFFVPNLNQVFIHVDVNEFAFNFSSLAYWDTVYMTLFYRLPCLPEHDYNVRTRSAI